MQKVIQNELKSPMVVPAGKEEFDNVRFLRKASLNGYVISRNW